MFTDADLISSYSRAQALADGVLVAVDSKVAGEAGFRCPLALTSAVYFDCVEWTEADAERNEQPQDQQGRLWDVLWMARCAALAHRDGSTVAFTVLRVPRDGSRNEPTEAHLVLTIGPGDDGEAVATIMEPGED